MSSLAINSVCTCVPMTVMYTSVHLSATQLPQLLVFLHILPTSLIVLETTNETLSTSPILPLRQDQRGRASLVVCMALFLKADNAGTNTGDAAVALAEICGRRHFGVFSDVETLPVKCKVRLQWKSLFTIGIHCIRVIYDFSGACLHLQLNISLHPCLVRMDAPKNLRIRLRTRLQISELYCCSHWQIACQFRNDAFGNFNFSCTILKLHGFANHRQHVFILHQIH